MRRTPANTFEWPWLLLCEGESDKRFLDRLIESRGIASEFYVQFPDRHGGNQAGRSLFGRYLNTVATTSESFMQNVRAVLVVSDNDDDPDKSLAEVQQQLRDAGGFGVPDDEKIVANAAGFPDTVILMIPFGERGNLETLCLSAAYAKWALEPQLDAFIAGTPAHEWAFGKQSKSRIQVTLAVTCETKPDTSFANHWLEREEFRIPLDHECFNDLVSFLSDFGTLLEEA